MKVELEKLPTVKLLAVHHACVRAADATDAYDGMRRAVEKVLAQRYGLCNDNGYKI
jgi:hypothetical protein